ncbi:MULTISPECIES: ATP-binding protein [Gordonia]|uniref:ATP-binding protein n=1 Tax=Gordonia TaxID=2053 RepID=UPI0007EA4F47|nr:MULTISPECIES: ATP-binding protein [Gordonia]OBC06986.1 hypothetical protein A5785_09015 [Gordonia sp. 852002-50395_SCH5434458]OBC17864.1 hypothetical protein A5786_17905 [Gordonia sp. 852002-50816_SCH5313054-a]OBC18262.1 hypothetical protein A5788_10670 [Gordonia sp. 852002-50816_SCH5313054-c]SKX69951.1 Type IV secretory pathway, VirB4 components [Mycobacteroides abscessus subsp. abscessus]
MGTHSIIEAVAERPSHLPDVDVAVAVEAERVSMGQKILRAIGLGPHPDAVADTPGEVSFDDIPTDLPFDVLNAALGPRPPAKGFRRPFGGWAANVEPGAWWQSTTAEMPGFYPFPAPSGARVRGVPIGRNLHTAEPIGLDPAQWLVDGLVTNTGIWVQGQPGIGKSSFLKRLLMGLVGFGFMGIIPGDLKDEYTPLVGAIGGEVFRIGRGLHSLNPLDRGPLVAVIAGITGAERDQLESLANSRRLALLESLLAIVGRAELTPTERLLLGTATAIADDAAGDEEPTIPDVLRALDNGSDALRKIMAVPSAVGGVEDMTYQREIREFRNTLHLLCSDNGPIKGMFDRPSTIKVTKDLPAVSLSLSAIEDDGDDVVGAAMLCSWTWGAAVIEAQQASGNRRNIFQPQDELWRGLRAGPGLVEKTDRMTRLNRHRGIVSAQSTHSLSDLDALATVEDRAKARGMAARNAIKVLGGLDGEEMKRLHELTPFTSRERAMVTSWSAPPTWVPGQRHPGRGKYLVKSGARMGLPVVMEFDPAEAALYNTDTAWNGVTASFDTKGTTRADSDVA